MAFLPSAARVRALSFAPALALAGSNRRSPPTRRRDRPAAGRADGVARGAHRPSGSSSCSAARRDVPIMPRWRRWLPGRRARSRRPEAGRRTSTHHIARVPALAVRTTSHRDDRSCARGRPGSCRRRPPGGPARNRPGAGPGMPAARCRRPQVARRVLRRHVHRAVSEIDLVMPAGPTTRPMCGRAGQLPAPDDPTSPADACFSRGAARRTGRSRRGGRVRAARGSGPGPPGWRCGGAPALRSETTRTSCAFLAHARADSRPSGLARRSGLLA